MKEKVFSEEQLNVLADLILNEMTKLREFTHGRGDAVREALLEEIGSLHTLYNYLIA